jgi:hypothetical protein
MSRFAATLVLLLASAGCSAGPHDKTSEGCAAGQTALCHQPPDHSSSGQGDGAGGGNGGGMGHGMM